MSHNNPIHRIDLHTRDTSVPTDLRLWIMEKRCPSCTENAYIESIADEETYVDDEEFVRTEREPRHVPYKDFMCGGCGTIFREYVGSIALRILVESDIQSERTVRHA